MGQENAKMDDATMKIVFEEQTRSFSADKPIVGQIEIDSKSAIPAYGIEVYLKQVDRSYKIDRGDKGQQYHNYAERVNRIGNKMVVNFSDNIIPFGKSQYPFSFQIPPDLPMDVYFRETDFWIKLRYFLKAQIVPVSLDLICDDDFESKLRAEEMVLISPAKPVIVNPQKQVSVGWRKAVGLLKTDYVLC